MVMFLSLRGVPPELNGVTLKRLHGTRKKRGGLTLSAVGRALDADRCQYY
jgi:hypothetical protein